MLGVNTVEGQTRSLTWTGTRFELAVQFKGEFFERQN